MFVVHYGIISETPVTLLLIPKIMQFDFLSFIEDRARFSHFLGDMFAEVVGIPGPNDTSDENCTQNNVSFFRIWLDYAKCSCFDGLIWKIFRNIFVNQE